MLKSRLQEAESSVHLNLTTSRFSPKTSRLVEVNPPSPSPATTSSTNLQKQASNPQSSTDSTLAVSPLVGQKNLVGISDHQVLEDLVTSKRISPSNLSEKEVFALCSLNFLFISSKEVRLHYYCLDLAFLSSREM